jgi:probable rRNA maturation factor
VIRIEIANHQETLPLDRRLVRRAVTMVLRDAGIAEADISVAVVDDATIRDLHRQYLDDDTPTDVLSFVLDRSDARLEGEVVASADTAAREASRYGWSGGEELLLYILHGALHLVGHDDVAPTARSQMRVREQECLARLGIAVPKARSAGSSRRG